MFQLSKGNLKIPMKIPMRGIFLEKFLGLLTCSCDQRFVAGGEIWLACARTPMKCACFL